MFTRTAGRRIITIGTSSNPAVRTRKATRLCHAAPRIHTFEEDIAAEKAKLEAQVAKIKHGAQMDALRKKIRQLDTASHMNDWLRSPGLRSPE